MMFIARVSGVGEVDGVRWIEARADNEMIFRFKQPEGVRIELCDAVSFSRDLIGGPTHVQLYKVAAAIRIEVRPEDVRDLSDWRIVGEAKFPGSGTAIRLYASGEVEVDSPQPGSSGPRGTAGFDRLEHFEEYAESTGSRWLQPEYAKAGSVELRQAILKWIKETALPELKAAQARFKY